MKVYAVAKWDRYYPLTDNVFKVFSNDRDAYIFLDEIKRKDAERNSEYDNYDVLVYEVEN